MRSSRPTRTRSACPCGAAGRVVLAFRLRASPRRRPAASAVPAASVARSARRRVRGRRQATTGRSARRREGEPPPAAASPSTARSACPVPAVTGFRRGGSARRDSACRPRRRSPLSPLSSPRPPPECWEHSSPWPSPCSLAPGSGERSSAPRSLAAPEYGERTRRATMIWILMWASCARLREGARCDCVPWAPRSWI